jgi:hypothetical protein
MHEPPLVGLLAIPEVFTLHTILGHQLTRAYHGIPVEIAEKKCFHAPYSLHSQRQLMPNGEAP